MESYTRPSSIEAYKYMVVDGLREARKLVNEDPFRAVEELETLTDVLPPEIRASVEERVEELREELEKELDGVSAVPTSMEVEAMRDAYRRAARSWIRTIVDALHKHGFIIWRHEVLTGYADEV